MQSSSRRRLVGFGIGGLACLLPALRFPAVAHAQPSGKVAHVGFVATTTPLSELPAQPAMRGLLDGLRERGWVEGRNLVIERRSAEGDWDQLPGIVAQLLERKADVIVVPGGVAVRLAKDGRIQVPIVVAGIDDLVQAGVAKSLAHPGGNVTGVVSDVDTDSDSKRLQFFLELLPRKPARMAFLGTKAEWENPYGENVRRSAEKLGIELVLAEGSNRGFANAFAALRKQKAEAIFVARGVTTYAYRHLVSEIVVASGVPSACPGLTEFTELGCLMSYGGNTYAMYRRAASHVDRILNGAKPGDLPIERPNIFELTLNLRTARALGITVPPALRARADRVIE